MPPGAARAAVTDDRVAVTPEHVRRLIAAQFPRLGAPAGAAGGAGRLGQPQLPPRRGHEACGCRAPRATPRRRRRSTAGCRAWRRACRCRSPSRWRSGRPGRASLDLVGAALDRRRDRRPRPDRRCLALRRRAGGLPSGALAHPRRGGPARRPAQLLPRRVARGLRRRDAGLPRRRSGRGRRRCRARLLGGGAGGGVARSGGLGARRHRRGQPDRARRAARGGDRLRLLRRRRPGLRPASSPGRSSAARPASASAPRSAPTPRPGPAPAAGRSGRRCSTLAGGGAAPAAEAPPARVVRRGARREHRRN